MAPSTWRLPGIQPLEVTDWLTRDDAFAGQMALRDKLLINQPNLVHAMCPGSEAAAEECLSLVLAHLADDDGYQIGKNEVVRPDGIPVPIDMDQPLLTAGRLVQEDFCVLEKSGDEHVLTAAVLCFPAGWTLSEKIGRPLVRIHVPVEDYDEAIAKRVQRLFDAIRVEQPLRRANALLYDNPALFTPRRESEGERHINPSGNYLRSEKQTLRRLPETDAVVFGIHTYLVELDSLTAEQLSSLDLVRERYAAF
ncbi:MAG: DUF3445 domain-containing protein [Boseongicola sp.]|nr:DUF3445 domain-containing protein [Boseongicola sp.]